tara:strand:- start:66 stop:593 length:528 start_codon:yes stop_codon:yes gene_type:complete
MKVNHYAKILVGDYQFADKIKEQVFSCLKTCNPIPQNNSNVKASIHTEWDWEPDNITFRNLKSFIREEVEKYFSPGATSAGSRNWIYCRSFWANVYEKGDYAQSHCHKPFDFSFAYFVKSMWYYPPLVFTDSGKRIRPKEGRYVIFPSYLLHHVPKHRYNGVRITLSGNLGINRT